MNRIRKITGLIKSNYDFQQIVNDMIKYCDRYETGIAVVNNSPKEEYKFIRGITSMGRTIEIRDKTNLIIDFTESCSKNYAEFIIRELSSFNLNMSTIEVENEFKKTITLHLLFLEYHLSLL